MNRHFAFCTRPWRPWWTPMHGTVAVKRMSCIPTFNPGDYPMDFDAKFWRGSPSDAWDPCNLPTGLHFRTASYLCVCDIDVITSHRTCVFSALVKWASGLEMTSHHFGMAVKPQNSLSSKESACKDSCHHLWCHWRNWWIKKKGSGRIYKGCLGKTSTE